MERKGFPDSYDVGALLRFLSAIKSGQPDVRAPVYSHLTYDVLPGEYVTIDRPDILIFEGLNVLQPRDLPKDGKFVPFLSDFFDFSIYIDAEEELIHDWYVARFMRLRETAFRDPQSFFHRYSRAVGGRRAGDRRRPVGEHQPEEPAREHPADEAARRSHPAQGRQPPGRGSGAEEALSSRHHGCRNGIVISACRIRRLTSLWVKHEGADDEDYSRTCRRDGTYGFGRSRGMRRPQAGECVRGH